jgi:Flp pilus assembly protein TadG
MTKKKTRPAGRRGTSLAEAVLILPVVLLLIAGGLDLAWQFYVRTCMARAAGEAVRLLAIRGATVAEAADVANSRLSSLHASFTVAPELGPASDPNDAVVQISVPQSEIAIGPFTMGSGGTIQVRAVMRIEPY